MAELILGAMAFGVATPGVILAFAECGEYIQKKVQTFKDAPAIIKELGRFGRDLHQGQVKINLELAEWANSLEDVDQIIKESIGDYITKLRTILMEVEHCLSGMVDKNGQLRRFYFTIIGERKAQQIVKSMKSWQAEFFNVIHLIEMRRRVLPSDVSLSWNRYRPKSYSRFSAHPDLLIGTAEIIRNNYATSISVLVEQKYIHDTNTLSDVREVATIFASRSYSNTSGGGILKCLGYREQGPRAELIFELPTAARQPRMLSEAIMSDPGEEFNVGHSLDSRYRLARQLCDTVFSVFTSGLVHKNLRTNTILLAVEDNESESSPTTPTELGNPYLTTWTLLRKATGLTSGPGASGTIEDFYRHPKRQGIQPEQRYNFGHDIYSLGVCLLEIGLWDPFFTSRSTVTLSALYRETAVHLRLVEAEHVDVIERLTWPAIVPKVLLHLAKSKIPQRMGIAYSELVVACLTCLEGGMGDTDCFKKSRPAAAIRFNDFVSQSFAFTSM
ncbi:hypothetical protein DE146DRAFT_647191 [Phaeosphaeria sp. MPI-PUGE-AT-0046c]|nr:hypothetical protein DE146DRAFT_647191 [Phaeosphaeria sp. MPI-PUGE-AT-0046c]